VDEQRGLAGTLGYLDEACTVGINRHDEPWYGQQGPWLVSTNPCEGTTLAQGSLTTQRLDDPMLTLGLERLSPFTGQHAALEDRLQATLDRQPVALCLLEKGFSTVEDLQLLQGTGRDFVVPVPANQGPKAIDHACPAEREPVGANRFVACAEHTLEGKQGSVLITMAFVWEPAADPRERMDGKEDLFVYACAREADAEQLLAWGKGYRQRWGIETGYRVLEHNRLRSTTQYRSNQVFELRGGVVGELVAHRAPCWTVSVSGEGAVEFPGVPGVVVAWVVPDQRCGLASQRGRAVQGRDASMQRRVGWLIGCGSVRVGPGALRVCSPHNRRGRGILQAVGVVVRS
jgi:hypothetical protein